ncbi:hypothetical protein [Escherichia coli]|uniref:hypothetical protein n=1 Tax=Escherichia coli TaxID=562 RepID=UPI002360D913|nr:hypothetical protein [Escherichia coli]
MKYLAFFIGALSAATANGTELYKYVPESLTIDLGLEESVTGWREGISREVSLDSGYLEMPYSKIIGQYNPLTVKYPRLQIPSSKEIYSATTKKLGSLRVYFNNTGHTTLHMNNPFTNAEDIWVRSEGDLTYPDTAGQKQVVAVQCPLPEYVLAGRDLTWMWISTTMAFYPEQMSSDIGILSTYATCKYNFRVVPEIDLTLKNEFMNITGVSGNPSIQSNQIIAKGYGGAGVRATLSITNPQPNDIIVSFSATDFDQTTQTVLPTDQGAPTDFYVKVNNTNPGSREYRVNFTAQYE